MSSFSGLGIDGMAGSLGGNAMAEMWRARLAQGPMGPQGPLGTQGFSGPQGLSGPQGPTAAPQGFADPVRTPEIPSRAPSIGGSTGSSGGFGDVLAQAIEGVDSLQKDVSSKTQALATGEPVALHDVMTSMGKSEVAFNLLLEVRNKLVDAWEKLSRSVV